MIRSISRNSALALALVMSVAACDSAIGPANESSIILSRGGSSSALSTSVLASFSGDASFASVPLGSVSSIKVRITGVQALPASQDEGEEGAWVSLDVNAGSEIDLMALSESGVEIASGELAAGTYGNLRLMVDNASITFNAPVTVGGGPAARSYEAGQAYPLRIPSAAQTGIKVPTASFVVTETVGDVVKVVFDAGASVQAIQAIPTGVMMSPVLTARKN